MTQDHKRILVVEDDMDIRSILTEILIDSGYHVETANNGAEALDKLQKDARFHLILLDLMMPVMNGLEFRQRQRSDARISMIPVVVMSADGQVGEKTKNAGIETCIKKPLDLNDFLKTVASEISRSTTNNKL